MVREDSWVVRIREKTGVGVKSLSPLGHFIPTPTAFLPESLR